MTDKAKDYGEPWECPDLGIVTRRQSEQPNHEVAVADFEDQEKGARAAACVNALAQCPDPEAFVAAVKTQVAQQEKALRFLGEWHIRYKFTREGQSKIIHDTISSLTAKQLPALAWLRKEEQ